MKTLRSDGGQRPTLCWRLGAIALFAKVNAKLLLIKARQSKCVCDGGGGGVRLEFIRYCRHTLSTKTGFSHVDWKFRNLFWVIRRFLSVWRSWYLSTRWSWFYLIYAFGKEPKESVCKRKAEPEGGITLSTVKSLHFLLFFEGENGLQFW